MSKLVELKKKEYEEFVKNHQQKSHFLQSYNWGEFASIKKNLTPYYLGLISDQGKIMATALLLQKKLPLNLSYFYIPRGFVVDFNNRDLVKQLTSAIIKFCKEKKAIFFKIDPDIIYQKTNYLGSKVELSNHPEEVLNLLKSLGYKHLGFTKNFETSQPRYTFRIDLKKDIEEIMSHFSKTTKQRIQKAEKLGVEVSIGDEEDIDTFYKLMMLTENRKDFVSFPKDYYKTQYQIFAKDHMATLFLGKVNTTKILKNDEEKLKEIDKDLKQIEGENLSKNAKNKRKNLESQKDNIEKEIEKFQKAKEKYGEVITLNAHMIITYGNKAWVLYAGNHNILTESYSNYKTYLEHIKYCKERKLEIYDQFGTIGDLSQDNPRLGLHEFKKKFGGDYIEFIGEFDYILKPFMYFVFQKLVPFYRNMVKRKKKKELKNETEGNK